MCITDWDAYMRYQRRLDRSWMPASVRKELLRRVGLMVNVDARDPGATRAYQRLYTDLQRGMFDDPEMIARMERFRRARRLLVKLGKMSGTNADLKDAVHARLTADLEWDVVPDEADPEPRVRR